MPERTLFDATAHLQALDSKRISAVELLDAAVARYNVVNPKINAVVATDFERARSRAAVIDDLRMRGESPGPLAGLPMTIKDCLDVDGMPASCGVAGLLNRPGADAVAVAKVRQAGAVIWGKTNVPVMVADWQSYNPVYGTTNNPWDLSRGPGGSSGGAAAALATGITALEIGSDIGGSLRVPASLCGVFAHKPTHGLVSQRGHVPPAPGTIGEGDLNVVGPMARSVRDLRLLLSVIANGPIGAKAPPADLKGLRIGVWAQEDDFPLDPECAAAIAGLAVSLTDQGAVVQPIRPTETKPLMDAYIVLLLSVVGRSQPVKTQRAMRRLRGLVQLMRGVGIPDPAWAAQVMASTATHGEWLGANETRARIGERMKGIFEQVDVIIAPATPVCAFPHDHSNFNRRTLALSDGTKVPYRSMLNWIALATACGLPATAIPIGPLSNGLPFGVQVIGPRGGDSRTLAVAEAIELAFGGFVSPPPLAG
jgi:amidase